MTQSKPVTITATYRIVTPMFCSGADQGRAELRLSSFKGSLRFWWRTMMWEELHLHQEQKPHEALLRAESEIFGSSESRVGQSGVRIRMAKLPIVSLSEVGDIFEGGKQTGSHYIGYGVMDAFGAKAGRLTRPMIPTGEFTVELRTSPRLSEQQVEQVKRAMILLGTVGGLGSKSRKGFGSLSLVSMNQNDTALELSDNVEDRLRLCLLKRKSSLSDWTAWSTQSRVVVLKSNAKNANELLNIVGREQVFFRSWGHKAKVLDGDREGNFEDDHDLSKGKATSINYPARSVFGLPHSYGGGNSVDPAKHKRRASPLFIHLHQVDESSTPMCIVAFLPSKFLPDGEGLNVFRKNVPFKTCDELWYPIHAFLDRLICDGRVKPAPRVGYEKFPMESTWWKKNNSRLVGTEVQLG